ncbi:hypothetical protein PSN45_003742 [Yamadazyma tenuis]|uniref:SHQ1-domain-containing protein n=1 Tax=Candida tenuis (strain ATCC 10573 / BCRC 21748 / CBS 615 / JCM 9827 / NBRC 10315 / NRRL Y-1498 / VKM Y-70) TaxID=590646 RepID=G3B3F0_CANTC|nr:SHQ1-domain-containing protein [Yamadazyma tenuis ATCC 10573]EGV64151.1 SHQ1-domain-containing protein [Yamadazyma tenuis ATCC 10573]WEJ96206.1 hypothetical protein PSN45_003742 [Yamadazyma tenuis]
MLTPFFTISQNDEFVFIEVKITHVRFNSTTIEMTVDGPVFIFSLSPYYLRLRLPHNCVDDERSHAEFDAKNDCVNIKIPKETKGQDFPDLDLTAKLLARTNELVSSENISSKSLIEEMDVDNSITTKAALAEGEKFDWEVSQQAPESSVVSPANMYGFNNQYSNIIGVSMSNGNDINELANPENTPESQRIMERLIKENIKFDPEYYAADFMMSQDVQQDEKDFKSLMEWKNPVSSRFLKWYKAQQAKPKEAQESVMGVEFSKEQQQKMLDLPKKTYLISSSYKPELYLLIVSLLFAYHFDLRETEGDHNIESAWTIGKIVPQFGALDSKIVVGDSDTPIRATIITCIRRSLCFPLHRNYDLTMKVWNDVYYNLRGGKRLVVESLLDLKELFRFHDVYYVYDHIWLKDLVAWILRDEVTEMSLRYLAHDVKREMEKVDKSVITFEKVDPEFQEPDSDDEEETNEDDEMITLSVAEIEVMSRE